MLDLALWTKQQLLMCLPSHSQFVEFGKSQCATKNKCLKGSQAVKYTSWCLHLHCPKQKTITEKELKSSFQVKN